MNNIEKAKDIFRSHDCSYFILYQDSQAILDEYLSYNIDKNIEIEWTREYILDNLNEMNSENMIKYVYKLHHCAVYKFDELTLNMCNKIKGTYLYINDDDKTILLLKLLQIMDKSKNKNVMKKIKIIMMEILLTINTSNLDRNGMKRYIDVKWNIKCK